MGQGSQAQFGRKDELDGFQRKDALRVEARDCRAKLSFAVVKRVSA